ncbi:hypothetical protein N5T80_02920 [Aliarcobacter cryaerophilus]|uniref:hypothetical protein n=1 Tax=Aliarcobacter cryaerophilus TaxID=28198 RepID=UPI0021B6433D|nr:hypothetical protein [Aliarcobacter cryaerophilus]MCT7545266.1 hypothetical protein [Aliarcobacter cryaerophilus]
MQNINWDKLQPYSGDTKKSFEELCYQIVSEKFKDDILNGAILTSIDDSGGGDGVEFYLTYENGDVYGWQAKYFCRLNEGGRKEQIKKSLQTTYDKHSNIKKWFFCSKCNFTPDEKKWFDYELAISIKNGKQVLPTNHNVELIHWGESELLTYLKNYFNIHKFFFSEKLLTFEWFENRYKIDIEKTQIKAKYTSQIHIPQAIEKSIYKILGGQSLINSLINESGIDNINADIKNYKESILLIFVRNFEEKYKEIKNELEKILFKSDKFLDDISDLLLEIEKTILKKDDLELRNKTNKLSKYIESIKEICKNYKNLDESKLCKPIQLFSYSPKELLEMGNINQVLEELDKKNAPINELRSIFFSPLSILNNIIQPLESFLNILQLREKSEFHISGEAGMGKTHVSFNIYENLILNQKEPAIFIFAKDIYTDQNLENQLKDNFSIPVDWSFDNFLGALEISARVYKVKIPIIIDGLNESTHWNSVWKNGLENFISKLKLYPHIFLITTYRNSYEDQLFPNKYFEHNDRWRLKEYIYGFGGLNWKAIETYFRYYKIKLENHSNAIGYFKHPLHLRIFCETKNPNRSKEVKVSFQNEDLFDVFDEYIQISNENITTLLKEIDPKYNNDFTQKKLLQLSKYFWENSTRGMPRSEKLFRDDELRIFEGENLLIYRDWNIDNNKEEIQFTYDLLGGYLISKYLIQSYQEYYPIIKVPSNNWIVKVAKAFSDEYIPERATDLCYESFKKTSILINTVMSNKVALEKFITSREFKKRLLEFKTEHPLYDDILRTITILIIKKSNILLFNILENERARKYSIESLFEINSKFIKENEELIKNFLENEFISNSEQLLNLSKQIEFDSEHPLNFHFWSDLLKKLSMLERDLFWSEYIRKNHSWYGNSYFRDFVLDFERICKEKKILSDRIHIAAKKIMWIFSTNIRILRDEATRALYYYARKYPKEFLDLLKYSIDINDTYVVERILAVTYGLAMARQNDFDDESYRKDYLPLYGKFLFNNMFSSEAKYPTTHILARDYAKRTIDIALIHHSSLLTNSEKELIKYPLKDYFHKEWGTIPNYKELKYRFGTPIHMDFENYTIGRLIEGRSNYDSKHKEYKLILSQIYWRMYNLGYLFTKFGEIDKQIGDDSWRNSNNESAGKIDRYGKKYSWIAFYEMAGHRSDLGLLKKWENEDELRISDTDIDPSFPIELRKYNLFEEINKNNFLGDLEKEAVTWYSNDNDLDIGDYIKLNSHLGTNEKNDWFLLKGSISQKDKEDQTRDVNIGINAILVDREEYKKIKNLTDKYHDYSFDYLQNIEDHYIYDGEIHWCDLIPNDYSRDFQISYNYHDVERIKKELKVFNNGKNLSEIENDELEKKKKEFLDKAWDKVFDDDFDVNIPSLSNNDETTKKIAEEMGYTTEYIDTTYTQQDNDNIEINIETTIFRNSWESYHSEIISSGETIVPSKNISNYFGLHLKPQSSDLYNQNGEIISTSLKFGESYDNKSTFTYIRKDYLERYVKEKNKQLIWLQWTEKRYFPKGVKKLSYSGEREKTEYRNYYKIIQ